MDKEILPKLETSSKNPSTASSSKSQEEMRSKFSPHAQNKVDSDYNRTKQDFYRMELDKIDEIHPLNRPHMRKAYFAYLQNTPGSRKAIKECAKSLPPCK
ncbi:hypothetical protein KUTeg_000789 [Tegillarca granosa]|nr:hypothetical protein KUTeg_000789 [Tegillarca granosa]